MSSSTKWAASSCHGSLRASFTPCKIGGVGLNGAEFHPRSRVLRELGESGGRCLRCARRASISGTAPPKISLYPCFFSGLTGFTGVEAAAAASASPNIIACWADVDAGGDGASVGARADGGSCADSKARISSELGPGAGVAPSAARPRGMASIRDVQDLFSFGGQKRTKTDTGSTKIYSFKNGSRKILPHSATAFIHASL